MWTCLCALCVLWVPPILCAFHGSCPRKEPPPGVVIVSLGSDLVLTCGGHVIVNGAKVLSNSHGFPAAVTRSTVNSISHNAVLPHISMSREPGGHGITTSASSASVSHPIRAKSDWDGGHVGDFEEGIDEEEKGKRAAKFNIRWKFNGKDVEGNTETTLSLSRVRMSDTGRYSCHQGGTERFSTRVIVAGPPETPHLFCYKKSPSSKIRCEWTPQTPVHKGTSCSLLIRKSLTDSFLRVPCSYSVRRSRCWCALDHNENDKRTTHQAFLCASSLISNVTSEVLYFRPLQILKPDPPYNVSVHPEEGLPRSLMIRWKPPYTWKSQDRFYELIYELRYKPLISLSYQTVTIREHMTTHTITDAEEGQEYEVQVRTKDEYDGQWSDWSAPRSGLSWTDMTEDKLLTTPLPSLYGEGSGAEDPFEDFSMSTASPQLISHYYLWIMIMASIGLSIAMLVVYTLRYKDKCMSKLQSLGLLAQCSDSVHPRPAPAPAVAVRRALLNRDRPPNEVKDRSEEQGPRTGERIDATNFDNTSYFLVKREI